VLRAQPLLDNTSHDLPPSRYLPPRPRARRRPPELSFVQRQTSRGKYTPATFLQARETAVISERIITAALPPAQALLVLGLRPTARHWMFAVLDRRLAGPNATGAAQPTVRRAFAAES
jgi:hypothetical protein